MEFERKAPSVYIEMDPDMWSAYFDVEALEAGQPDEFVTRIQCNAPGKFTHQTVCILSGDQFPSATHVRIRVRRGTLSFTRLLFRDKNVGEAHPIGMIHGDCVFTSNQTAISDQRHKTDVSEVDTGLLLGFCNSLRPSMYVRTDITPQPRLGLIAQDVETALKDNALPTSPFIGTHYQAIDRDGPIEELMGLDYSRLTVALLGAVKELTNRITQLESQVT